jgi:hypothetical protein
METEEFQVLALKVISREASPEELEKLKVELYRNSSRREEFDSLLATSGVVKELHPLVAAASASDVKLPAYRMGELQGAVRSAFPQTKAQAKRSLWESIFSPDVSLGGAFAMVVILCGFFFFANLQPHLVSIGIYDGYATRGDQPGSALATPTDMKVRNFGEIRDYDVWSQTQLRSNEKARIAISRGETTRIQVWQREGGKIKTQTFEISGEDSSQVQKKLDEICQSLRN